LAVEDDFFLVEDDFFLEDDFLVELDLCVELECFVTVLVTALFTSSTLQDPDSGLHSISVVSAGDILPATAETSSRAKAEMVEMLRILNQKLNERRKELIASTEQNKTERMVEYLLQHPLTPPYKPL
jgi:hypothetical protein